MLGATGDLLPDFTFDELLAKLDHINGCEFARREAENQLASVKRKDSETIVKYAQRVSQLVNRAYPYYPSQARDEQALRAFLQGLSTKYDFRLKMKTMQFKTLHEAVSYGANLDHVLREERPDRNNVMSRFTEVQSDHESDTEEAEYEMMRKTMEKMGKKFDRFEKKLNKNHFIKEQSNAYDNSDKDQNSNGENKYKPVRKCPNCGHETPRYNKQNTACFICSEMGHWSRECPMRDNTQEQSQPLN